MTDQKKDPSSQENEKSASPNAILVDLSIDDVKKALWDLWSPQLVGKDSHFLGERLASVTAEKAWLKKSFDILVGKYSESQKLLLEITSEQKRVHAVYQKQIIDLSDRLAAAGL